MLVAAAMTLKAAAAQELPKIAQTPPLGWLSWQHYRCNRDCTADPDNCFSEKMIRRTADLMVSEGYAAAGYSYLNMVSCAAYALALLLEPGCRACV